MSTDPFVAVAALPGVDDAVVDARTMVDRLRAHPVLRRRAAEVATESALRGARASAALDGVVWTIDEVRAVDRREHRPKAAVVSGAVRVGAELPSLARDLERAPRQVFARLHALAAAGLVDADELGRPRGDEQVDDDALELGPPPPASDMTVRLDALAALLTAPTTAPAIVVAALAHGELLVLQPFVRSSGVVARAVERLLLRVRGLDPDGLSAPEVGHLTAGPGYATAARGYADGTADGVAVWVVHCAHAVAVGAQEGLAVCESIARG